MPIREILTDERGSMIWDVPEPAYVLLGSLVIGLLAWAAGPRTAQYLAPQIGAVASGIAQAVKSPRRPDLLDSSPDFKEHDER